MHTMLQPLRLVLAAAVLVVALPAHAPSSSKPEPATPVGVYELSPLPEGMDGQVTIFPSPLPGVWIGAVTVNGEVVTEETIYITRREGGGYDWQNTRKGPRTGKVGAGTLAWDGDHYDSEVTQGDFKGTKRRLDPI